MSDALTIAEISKASLDARQSASIEDLRAELQALRTEYEALRTDFAQVKDRLTQLTTAHNAEVGKRQQTDQNVTALCERVGQRLVYQDGDAAGIVLPDGSFFRIVPARGSAILDTQPAS